jgi:hypothetical protein
VLASVAKSENRASNEEHFGLLLDGAPHFLVVLVFFGDVDRFFDLAEDEVAVGIVGLGGMG